MNVTASIGAKGRKVEQVLVGARTVFMRDGFDGASVDEIARVSRVSKATLYSYFPDKRIMFMEVAKAECNRQAQRSMKMIEGSRHVSDALRTAGQNLIGFLASDFGLSVYRICVAESDRFPELGRQFYESGPRMVRDRIVAFLRDAMARGELRIDDLELAADQFAELCKADLFPRILFCGECRPSQAEIDRVIDGAVATFLARYGVSRPA